MLLAFFPVVLASFVMRSLSSMEKRVEEVSRQNRELDVMRDISNTFGISARVDRYERVFAAVGRLLPESAMAIIEWLDGVGAGAEEAFSVHRSSIRPPIGPRPSPVCGETSPSRPRAITRSAFASRPSRCTPA
jgi:hypothetical protein